MRKFVIALAATVAIGAIAWSSVEPASALGGCGRNGHRNAYGQCVFGGQNQRWCVRTTGHRRTYVGGGIYRCL